MADDEETNPKLFSGSEDEQDSSRSAASDSDSEPNPYVDWSSDSDEDEYEPPPPTRRGIFGGGTRRARREGGVERRRPELPESREENAKEFIELLSSPQMMESRDLWIQEDRKDRLFNFPKDPENWTEEDLWEMWADHPNGFDKQGWDPAWVGKKEMKVLREHAEDGRDVPIAPFYVPYRRSYPVVPPRSFHYSINRPKAVVEELDMIEEFLNWVSYIFPDDSTYEGTVWDDVAHGKGVYTAEQGLVRYEGEWLRNNMEGHGVVEVDIPDIEPVPGSKLEENMRAEGKIIKRDFMSPEDRKWLEMDVEDILSDEEIREIPWYENEEWVRQFGRKPEKGRYRYAGEWKHSRMHGCGVYEVNGRVLFGRFYFGELLNDPAGCDEDVSAMHAGIAEVAAAKARMFVNKPDGMVREQNGPYSDPQHPYFYEEEDVWMAPGFINQFYEVPDYWKTYVHEVDQERGMWLNSFYKAPLRIPMPAELEYWWWSKDKKPEFVLINKEPEPDPEDPSQLIYTDDPVILHAPSGRIINYVEDEEHGIRLFWQPPLKDGEEVDPKKAKFLPLGFDDYYGLNQVAVPVENMWTEIANWAEEQKKEIEMEMKMMENEGELVDAELCLEEALEEMDEELKRIQKEAEQKAEKGLLEEEDLIVPELEEEEDIMASEITSQDEKTPAAEEEKKVEEQVEEEEEEEEDFTRSSFGSVIEDKDSTKDDQEENKSGKSPFSSLSLSLASLSLVSSSRLVSMVPPQLQRSFAAWRESKLPPKLASPPPPKSSPRLVSFPRGIDQSWKLRAARQTHCQVREITPSCSRNLSTRKASLRSQTNRGDHIWPHTPTEDDLQSILSLHTKLNVGVR
ncbi:Protein TIC like [Actinidia chinensis var. chinensis]|uniref:Protein TIC like n=1 Tax=Actinidia chinensis var. chinensis TaxID=1590841 RepID=A0A2R6PQZ3_ACTCC|nr:Protein TIC like [Actinidia chinensis var. chinensis]